MIRLLARSLRPDMAVPVGACGVLAVGAVGAVAVGVSFSGAAPVQAVPAAPPDVWGYDSQLRGMYVQPG